MIRRSPTLALVFAAACGVAYGLVSRFVFSGGSAVPRIGAAFAVMTMAYLFLVPFAIGYLTLSVAPDHLVRRRVYRVLLPLLSMVLAVLAVFATGWEGSICTAMVLPIALPLAWIGGAVAYALRRRTGKRRRVRTFVFCSVLILPYALAPVEGAMPHERELRVVERQVRIHASPAAVWRNIARVPRIRPDEYHTSFVHRIGFPRPVEATLSRDGVGGVRHASFEHGVVFLETVTAWEPGRLLAFTIHADPATIPPGALDEHVTVGGRYFDVLDGTYRIEAAGPDDVILHLGSTHRLSTDFNFYSSLWTDLVMGQIQENILQVVKRRAEAGR